MSPEEFKMLEDDEKIAFVGAALLYWKPGSGHWYQWFYQTSEDQILIALRAAGAIL